MKNYYKFMVITIVLSSLPFNSSGQYGLSLGKTHPRGDFGKAFKSSTLIEFNYIPLDQESRIKIEASIGFMLLKTVRDTFKTFGYKSGSNGIRVGSGYELYENFFSVTLALKNAYRFTDNKLSPIVGIDAYLFLNHYYYEYNVSLIIHEGEQGGEPFIGYHARVGLNYRFKEKLSFDLDFGRTATWEQGYGKFTFWKTALSINYYY